MAQELSKSVLFTRQVNQTAAGTSLVSTNAVDQAGFDAVSFVAMLGTVVSGTVCTLAAFESDTNTNSGGSAITGASVSATLTSGNGVFVVDAIRPSKRYVYATLTRATQNAAVDGVVSLQYRAREIPATQPATTTVALSTPEV